MKKFLLILILASPAWSAVTANSHLHIRTDGADTNGGGFDSTIANAGTDLSPFGLKNAAACSTGSANSGSTVCQSATVNISTTDAATTNNSTLTSSTGNFSSAIVGNWIYLTIGGGSCSGGGTVSTQWRQVTAFTNSTTITLDTTPAGAGVTCTGVTMNIGGAYLTLGNVITAGYIAGNTFDVRAGTYTVTATIALTTTGSISAPIMFRGFTSTPADADTNPPPVTVTTATNSTALFSGNGISYLTWRNMNFQSSAATKSSVYSPVTSGSGIIQFVHVSTGATGDTTHGPDRLVNAASIVASPVVIKDSWIKDCTNTTTGCIDTSAGTAVVYFLDSACTNMATGAACIYSNGQLITVHAYNSIFSGGSYGIRKAGTGNNLTTAVIHNCSFYNYATAGILDASNSGTPSVALENNIFYGSAGSSTGVSFTLTGMDQRMTANRYNAYGNNNTDRTGISAGFSDVTLTGNPFNSSTDFGLNATAGAGAACKAVGGPTTFAGLGSTGHSDIGAIQTAATGGGTRVY